MKCLDNVYVVSENGNNIAAAQTLTGALLVVAKISGNTEFHHDRDVSQSRWYCEAGGRRFTIDELLIV